MPVSCWKKYDSKVHKIKQKYSLEDCEIHTGWIVRSYLEQSKIQDFETLDHSQRRHEVNKLRKKEILRLQKSQKPSLYKQVRKNYKQTDQYIHLTYDERIAFIKEVADCIGAQSYIRVFAECIDKIHFDPDKAHRTADAQVLEQLVTRFERYMDNVSKGKEQKLYGALIHDNNETVSKKHTKLMKRFHKYGTVFSDIKHIIETPLYVDSELTSMIQIADLCAYSLRRYFENGEIDLLNRIMPRFDKYRGNIVGVRHFSEPDCECLFCKKKTVF